jgi:hypothetical protein
VRVALTAKVGVEEPDQVDQFRRIEAGHAFLGRLENIATFLKPGIQVFKEVVR